MLILSIDPGTRFVGVILYDTTADEITDCRTLKFRGSLEVRLVLLDAELIATMASSKALGCRVVAVERMFRNGNTADGPLHTAAHYVKRRAIDAEMRIVEMTTKAIRKRVCGSGGASKARVHQYLELLYQRKLTEDEADALAGARAAVDEVKTWKEARTA